jgi:hypothetical protein
VQYGSGKIDFHGIPPSHAGPSKGGAERMVRMVPPPSQAAMGSRQTSENELKVRAIDVGELLKSPPNRIDKAV